MTKMKRHPARAGFTRGLLLPALLALLPAAHAQSGATAAPSTSEVLIKSRRAPGDGSAVISAAESRLLNGKSASSCAFMAPYDVHYDDVYLRYMQSFYAGSSLASQIESRSMYAPLGDVSNMDRSGGFGEGLWNACGDANWRFAAGRAYIKHRDKTLGLAFEAFDHVDFPRALDLFTQAWNKIGYPEAALMLAQMNLHGLGTPKDVKRAIYWYGRLAGGTYEFPYFDPQNPLAMTPKVEASMALARIYEQGIGVPADRKEAHRWYAKAGEAGYMPALDILGLDLLTGAGGDQDPAKGAAMLKKAGEAGFLPAAYHLGQAYHDGVGVPRDYQQASTWFNAAAKAGLPAAMYAAGRMIDLGEGMPADPAKAIVYYKEAALHGDRDAEFALGTYFYTGDVVGRKDPVVARKWFQAAAFQAQPEAMYNMGAMLMSGEGGAKDPALAYAWFNLARKLGYAQAEQAVRTLGPQLSPSELQRAGAILEPVAVR